MSKVYYKFKSAKTYDSVTFDGTGISVFDLKREVIIAKKLGKGTDFDLSIAHAETEEEYTDDMKVIPKNTCILVSRRPASRPGRGTAQRYVNSTMPASMLSKHAGLAPPPPGSNMMPGMVGGGAGGSISAAGAPERMKTSLDNTKSSTVTEAEDQEAEAPVNENMTEEERISAMFQATEKHWEQQQKKMENQRPVMGQNFRGRGTGRGGYFPRGGGQGGPGAFPHQGGAGGAPSDNGYQNDPNMPQRAPPPGYVCFRCGQKGHYINNCPTLGDKDFNRPRLKRTTGIPRIFLKTVEGSATGGAPGAAGPGEGGVMVTQNGDLVVAQPNELAWNKLKGVASQSSLGSTDLYEHIPVPKELECPLCKRLLRDAVLSPCCGASFCDECIRTYLLENEDESLRLTCPTCKKHAKPDELVPNKALRDAVEHLLRDHATGGAKKASTPVPPLQSDKRMSSPANSVNAGDEKSEGAGTPNQTTAAASAKPKQAFTSSLPIMTSTRRNYTIIAKPEGQSQPQQPVQQKMASTAAIELTGPGLQVGSRGSSPVVGRGTQSEQVLQKQEGGWGGPEGSPAMNNLMGRSAPGETGGMMRGPGDVYEEDFIDEPGSQFVGNGMPMNMRNGMNGMGPMNNGMVMQQGNGVMFRSNDMYGQPLPFGNDYYGNSGMMRQGGPPPMMMNRNMPGMYMGPQPGMNGEMMMGIGGPDGFRGVPYQQQRGPMMMYPRGPPQMQQPMQPMGHMPFHMQQQQMMMNRPKRPREQMDVIDVVNRGKQPRIDGDL